MLTCLKTGCHAYIEQYDQWVYGDAYTTAEGSCRGLLVIRVVDISMGKPIEHASAHHIDVVDVSKWFDHHFESDRASTLICEGFWRWHGHKGKPLNKGESA